MAKDGEYLEIVSEAGEVIGKETREKIHREGLLHREIHVWLYTPKDELIFQHRAKDKDTFPDLLDASVAGHVELGMEYVDSAMQEMEEEAGLTVIREDLMFVSTEKIKSYDPATNKINHRLQATYLYQFDGSVEDLRIEKGKAIGFEVWPFDTILSLSIEQSQRFIPTIIPEAQEVIRLLRKQS